MTRRSQPRVLALSTSRERHEGTPDALLRDLQLFRLLDNRHPQSSLARWSSVCYCPVIQMKCLGRHQWYWNWPRSCSSMIIVPVLLEHSIVRRLYAACGHDDQFLAMRRGFAHDLTKMYLYPGPCKIVSMDDRALVVLSAVEALQQAWH